MGQWEGRLNHPRQPPLHASLKRKSPVSCPHHDVRFPTGKKNERIHKLVMNVRMPYALWLCLNRVAQPRICGSTHSFDVGPAVI